MSLLHALPGILQQQGAGGGGGVSLVGYASAHPNTSSTVNVTLPGGSAAGDLAVSMSFANLTNTATPTGFTLLVLDNSDSQIESRTAYKTLDATDISNGYITMPGDPGFNGIPQMLWVVSGTAPAVDVYGNWSEFDGAGNGVFTVPSVTTSADGAIILVGAGTRSASGWADYAEYTDVETYVGSGSDHDTFAGHKTQTTAGATGAETITATGAGYGRGATVIVAVNEP